MVKSIYLLGVILLLTGCAGLNSAVRPPSPHDITSIESVIKTVPEKYQLHVEFALYRAGGNRKQLIKALESVSGEELAGMAFLISHMPAPDLRKLRADYLLENVRLAYQARREFPWAQEVPEDIFLNYVLPYVNVSETRDSWRRYFLEKYGAAARKKHTVAAIAGFLNRQVFNDHGITYNLQKRPRADQSPRETIKAGIASCTGQSIMIADALRSLGIPARVVGTPLWADESGNHTWFEVWDAGQWHYLDADRDGPYDETWFTERAGQIQMTGPRHRIYAISYRRTDLLFPTIWDPYVDYVYATDVTLNYQKSSDVPAKELQK